MNVRCLFGSCWLLIGAVGSALAGGSGLNVVVVANESSRDSLQLANYYAERRQVPPQNVVRMNWTNGNSDWGLSDFTNQLLNPLTAALQARGLAGQVDYVLLSMDIPIRTFSALPAYTHGNSTTTPLFYGFKTNGPATVRLPASCSLPESTVNAYVFTEDVFRQVRTNLAPTNTWLAVMLTASNLTDARAIVDSGMASDGTFPTNIVRLDKTGDMARNVRYPFFDNAIFDTRIQGACRLERNNPGSFSGSGPLLGWLTGWETFTLPAQTFVPGSMADSLTSYGGLIVGNNTQTSLLRFLWAGASGSYGTVDEPCNYPQKFPSPSVYFYQARGFSLAECYYLSLRNPWQGLLVGEPLAAPFARAGQGNWPNLPDGAALSGTTNLALAFAAADATRPLGQVDLFVDGVFFATLTNLPPAAGEKLSVTLGTNLFEYTVPAQATVKSVATGLAQTLNQASNTTRVVAYDTGDRLEMQFTDPTRPGSSIGLSGSVAAAPSGAARTVLRPGQPTFLDSISYGWRDYAASNAPVVGDWMQLSVRKTNGTTVLVAVTNQTAGATATAFGQQLASAVNASPALTQSDGLVLEDFYGSGPFIEFNLRARTAGWPASRMEVALTAATNVLLYTPGTNLLGASLNDLQPRNHLYLAAGATNLAFSFPLNTTLLSDGYHELTAVAYEGNHVQTQTRTTQRVRVQNTPFSATFATLVGDTNTAVEATLQFAVAANGAKPVHTLELFSTGGRFGVVSNAASAVFSLAGTNLDVGRHPFYALATATDGTRYRTETKWFRLVGPDAPFHVSLTSAAPTLSWPAAAGRSYGVFSATNLAGPYAQRAVVVPTNSAGLWQESATDAAQRFYKIVGP